MTRLDSVIRRLTAQRDLLDWASRIISPTGLVLELGLGNGRTYDHLRTRLPGREIYVFERSPAAHPACLPEPKYLMVGDIFDTLPPFIEAVGRRRAALIHADIGSGDERLNREVALRMSPLLDELLQPGGLLLADRSFALPHCEDVTRETGVAEGRYYVYRRQPESAYSAAEQRTSAR
ncbi:class I SAM-dependent methyltransferase [Microvirga puerhi]|uniref:Class I SAM-dependent methyltransferase n=1 Tax=Microvirga puerhi TaxID=2876078 RepID=A0ABS7VKE0_9HYPH|nr:class I SAM-dependent methyltransferase [Microvirga puerhi]MBZ6075487.1 class I SAM-dependent methyltransferase [Microvirga puerhi]